MNAIANSNVSTYTLPNDNLITAIDELRSAQLGLPCYAGFELAGPLISQISRLFPQKLMIIYILTDYRRRAIFNAHLAKLFFDQPIIDPTATRHKLTHTSSKELLLEAFGSLPSGFQGAVEKLGLEGQQPEIYTLLHKFMSDSIELRKSLSHASKIDASTITTLAALPIPLQNYELAKQIKKPEEVKKLIFTIETLAQDDDAKYASICTDVVLAAKRNHSVPAVLKRVYYEIPFPEPILENTEHLKHINTCADLHKAAVQFSNCLSSYCEENIRGEYQTYRWFENSRPVAVISIREDVPFGWKITDLRGKRNEYLDDELESKIIKHFENHGILKVFSMEKTLNDLSAAFKTEPSHFSEDIDDFIDGLLDEGNQI